MIQSIVVKTAPNSRSQAILQIGPLRIRAALGRSGIATRKREGDGKTPVGSMALLYGYWRRDRGPKPVTLLDMHPLGTGDLWCDASTHPAYNRFVRAPFKASHETMMREDGLYDICIVLDWNIRARRRGGGSAIFLHVARPGYKPTEGCIAISRRDMHRLLKAVGAATRVDTR
ncbi:L,D-transpeptidase [Rhizobium sp. L1K21]|uniref:L,D-transpeptidase family protein n=1 Tax=Rhizobium sp. L1K21 TaxID=2954933 RepID=UPI002092A6A4|nr:L,D-transpeptidase family protein [Rhizobium sp. L1K21]MCO6188106.1 L,D-transpeptidase family protein [Rhizobium sp. L1K21]